MDYTYPSVWFAYFFFALMFLLALFFCLKTVKDGYWGKDAEEIKYSVLEDGSGERRPS